MMPTKAVVNEIQQERILSSRHRRNFRRVKRKMNNSPLRPRPCKTLATDRPQLGCQDHLREQYCD